MLCLLEPNSRALRSAHPTLQEIPVSEKLKFTHESPGGFIDLDRGADDGVVNDSLGTVDIADSTGLDESKETGDAKQNNKPTRED